MSLPRRTVMMRGAGLQGVTFLATVPRVLVAGVRPVLAARLTDALRGRALLEPVADFDGLMQRLRTSTMHVDVIVIADHDARGASGSMLAAELAASWPRTALLAYCDSRSDASPDVRGLAIAGVHQIVFAGVNDGAVVLRDIVERARRQCAAEWVFARLRTTLPASMHLAIETALTRPERTPSVTHLAAQIGVHRKTLFNWCERAVPLSPGELLAWARLCLVGYYLQFTGSTVETIALDLGYASDTALRNLLRRYTGRTATQLRSEGGFAFIHQQFLNRLNPPPAAPNLHLL